MFIACLCGLIKAAVLDISSDLKNHLFQHLKTRQMNLVFYVPNSSLQMLEAIDDVVADIEADDLGKLIQTNLIRCNVVNKQKAINTFFDACNQIKEPGALTLTHTHTDELWLSRFANSGLNQFYTGPLRAENLIQFVLKVQPVVSQQVSSKEHFEQMRSLKHQPALLYFSKKNLSSSYKNLTRFMKHTFQLYHSSNTTSAANFKLPAYYDPQLNELIRAGDILKHIQKNYPLHFRRAVEQQKIKHQHLSDYYPRRDQNSLPLSPDVNTISDEGLKQLQSSPRKHVAVVLLGNNTQFFDFQFLRVNFGDLFQYYVVPEPHYNNSIPAMLGLSPLGERVSLEYQTVITSKVDELIRLIGCKPEYSQYFTFEELSKLGLALVYLSRETEVPASVCQIQQESGAVLKVLTKGAAEQWVVRQNTKSLPALLAVRGGKVVKRYNGEWNYNDLRKHLWPAITDSDL